ncbi:hypothetical protein Tco_1218327 [Tanacetum coccineum]
MKEKGDPCILVGYLTQSKGYRVYNKRTRLIVESIHLRFDEIKEISKTSIDNDTSADTTALSQQELDLLFIPLYDEFFTAGTSSVNKSSSPTDNSKQQDTPPTMNIQSSTKLTISTAIKVNAASENMLEVTTASEYQVNAANMDQDSAHMMAASNVPILKPSEYEIWRIRIEQYIQMIDYALWEVIDNGATMPKTTTIEGVVTVMPITTAKEKAQRILEVKDRSTLMMGIPNEHQLKFNSIKDAKKLLEAMEKRFDVNQKLLRSLSPEWNTHVVMWRNKADLDTMSMDDLYNNLKVYEPEVKGMSSSSLRTQNMAFVSSSNNNTSSTNGAVNTTQAVNTAHRVSTASTQVNVVNFTNIDNLSDVVIYAFFATQPNSHQLVHEDLQQIHPDDMEEMDLRWKMVMLTMRARSPKWSAITATRGDILPGSSDQAEEGPNYALMTFSSSSHDSKISNDSICLKSCLETAELLKSQNDQLLKDLKKFELMVRAYKTCLESVEEKLVNKLIECQIVNNCKKGLGYINNNAVLPPYTGNFMPPTPDLSFTGLEEFVNEPVVENNKAMSSKEEPKVVRKNDDALIIEEWVSNEEEEDASQPKIEKKTVRPSIVKKEFVKSI